MLDRTTQQRLAAARASIPRRRILQVGAGLLAGLVAPPLGGSLVQAQGATPATAAPRVLWHVPLALVVRDQPAVAGDALFVVGSSPEGEGWGTKDMVALDAATGAERWSAAGIRAASAPAAAGESVYVGLATGTVVEADDRRRYEGGGALLSLDATTGAERWRLELPGPGGAPVLAEGAIYAASVDLAALTADPRGASPPAWLVAADAADGGERWRVAAGAVAGLYPFRPAVAGNLVYAPSEDPSSVVAVDAATGAERWRGDPPGGAPVSFAPVAGDGLVAIVAGFALYALDAATGRRRWAYPRYAPKVHIEDGPFTIPLPPVVAGDAVYVTVDRADGRELVALDAATGRERWRTRVAAEARDLPVVAGGAVYIAAMQSLIALEAASGVERWRLPLDGLAVVPPVVTAGSVYAATVAVAEDGTRSGAVLSVTLG